MTAVSVPFDLLDRAVYLPAAESLVLADVHLGRAESSNVAAPIDDGGDARTRLEALLEQTRPETVVIAGDLLHSFSHVPRGVEAELRALEAAVADADAKLVVTPGNHDAMLESVFDGETAAAYRLDDGETVVCHGHEPPEADATRYLVGHDHPALSVDGKKHPCALYGPNAYRGAAVLMLPAFTRLAPGTTVNRMRDGDFQSPLVGGVDDWHPTIYDAETDDPLWFPPLGACRRLL